MSYQKFTVDNVACSRRFHIRFDSESLAKPHVQLECPHCGIEIFAADNHPDAIIAREENLVQLGDLSENIVRKCSYKDILSEKTQKPAKPASDD
jgi:hypothetical protein